MMTDKQLNALLDYIDARVEVWGQDKARKALIKEFGFFEDPVGRATTENREIKK